MQISHFVEGVREDLARLGALGDEATARIAANLADALAPALRARLLEALDVVVAEANRPGDPPGLVLTLVGDNATLTRPGAAGEPHPQAAGDLTARFALRLPDELKARIEREAQRRGASTNSWMVRALAREVAESLEHPGPRGAQELRGRGRS